MARVMWWAGTKEKGREVTVLRENPRARESVLHVGQAHTDTRATKTAKPTKRTASLKVLHVC